MSGFSQGNYYIGIDTTRSTFVEDLHRLIYIHSKLPYSTTAVADYVSYDTVNGQKYVVCVYSGERYVYTPPFSWGYFSREHTWCHSWMPSYPSTNGPEYTDQHHLFPTNQNRANSVRSNHPLGNVVYVTNTYLEGKLGYNTRGKLVYEPRDAHKGDAARALFYMALCYHGENGYNWSFQYLNQTKLPSLGEDSIEVSILLQWHEQDPPDALERARNDSIYKYQGNRNPFIDHPEYVRVIDFYTMTKRSQRQLAIEPSYSATNLVATALSMNEIQISWSDADPGIQAPSGYLVRVSAFSNMAVPHDGITYGDDTDLSDGEATVNIRYGSTTSVLITGVVPNTLYTVWMYSYNGDGEARNYKVDSTVPSDTCLVVGKSVVIYSLYGGGGNSGATYKNDFIVLYNTTSRTISLNGWSVQYASATGTTWQVTPLSGSIGGYRYYLIQEAAGAGGTVDLPTPDAIGTIAMSATAGKVALCRTSVPLNGGAPISPEIVDLVGYGATASFYEGSGPAPAPSNTTFITRDVDGTDTDDNSKDFSVTAVVLPKNSSTEANHPLSVELGALSAVPMRSGVTLYWHTVTETNNYGFIVERRRKGDNLWCSIGFVPGAGTSFSERSYSFFDWNVNGGAYVYRLKQIDTDGSISYSHEVEVFVEVPRKLTLAQNYPNPFNPITTIEFTIPQDGVTTLTLYDILGRRVSVLVNELLRAGSIYRIQYDASNVPSGMYYYCLESNGMSVVKAMMVLK